MRFPRRPTISIQALPSIHTAFATIYDQTSRTSANESPGSTIEEGIEVVPLERSNSTCAKIVSPVIDEKEIVPQTHLELYIATKPLPSLPHLRRKPTLKRRWNRLPVKQRVLVLIGIQLGLLLVLFGIYMSVRARLHNRKESSEVQSADVEPSLAPSSPPITKGIYSLPLGKARQQSSACLSTDNGSVAWACTDGGSLRVDISTSSSAQVTNELISLGSLGDPSQNIYGQQPPEVTSTKVFLAVKTAASGGEPVYSFKTTYNRTVLLPGSQLPQAGDSSTRTAHVEGTAIKLEDRPWLCFFNETIIEGFFYAPQDLTPTALRNISGAPQMPRFPYILELNEKWSLNGTQPYCERKKVSENGQLLPDGTNKYWLSLSEPAYVLTKARGNIISSTQQKGRRTPSMNTCQCEWICKHSKRGHARTIQTPY